MKPISLRRRIGVLVLLPIVAGSFITAVVSLTPIFSRYPVWIDQTVTDIVNGQGGQLMQVGNQLAEYSSGFLQIPLNYIVLVGNLMQHYYEGTLPIKQRFFNDESLQSKNVRNVIQLWLDNQTIPDYNLSMWYLLPNITSEYQLDKKDRDKLRDLAIFDSFLRPVLTTAKGKRTLEIFMGFEDDGFYYASPSAGYEFFLNFTGNADCIYNRQRPIPIFDVRCRPWFITTKASPEHFLPVLSKPYVILWDMRVGQNILWGLWLGNVLKLVISLDFNVKELDDIKLNIANGGAYTYTLNRDGSVFSYPNYSRYNKKVYTIFDLEFGGNATDEAIFFNRTILPYFLNGETILTKYKKNGVSLLVAIQPINVAMGRFGLYRRDLSTAVIMPEHDIWAKVDKLKEESHNILIVEVLVLAAIMVFGLIVGWM